MPRVKNRKTEEFRAYHRAYTTTPEYRTRHRDYRRRVKFEVFGHYGGACGCCAEKHLEFLTLDHIDGGGRKSRMLPGARSGHHFYLQLRKKGYPSRYRVLCFNCNAAMGLFGGCPHSGRE